jgi:RHS repeat-associated protein
MKKLCYFNSLLLILLSWAGTLKAQTNLPNNQTQTPNANGTKGIYTPAAYPNGYIPAKTTIWQPLKAIQTLEELTSPNRTVDEVARTTVFSDAWGKQLQTVNWQASPDKKDIIAPSVYDGFGREVFQFLPYTSTANDGSFRTNPFAEQYSFYTSTYSNQQPALRNEQIFYGKTIYEQSPLNRVMSSYAPGNSWIGSEGSNSERAAKADYLFNDNADAVKCWGIGYSALSFANDDAATNIPYVSRDYLAGELFKSVSIDEKGFQVIEYKDLNGQTILHKVQSGATISGPYIGWLCTYYVYDDLGRLRVTITPNVVNSMAQNNNWAINGDQLNGLCFRNEYDQRQRQIGTKSPGKAWSFTVYDNKDRPVFVQDGNLADLPNKQWMGTLYDALNRVVQTGVLNYNGNRTQLQQLVDAQLNGNTVVSIGMVGPSSIPADLIISERQTGRLAYNASNNIIIQETFISENNAEFVAEITTASSSTYAGTQIINTSPIPSGTSFIPLRYLFYDNYTFTNKNFNSSFNAQLVAGNNLFPEALSLQSSLLVNGKLTGTRVKLIEQPTDLSIGAWLEEIHFYDEKGRSIQVQSDHYKGGINTITNRYNFSGQFISGYQSHNNASANINMLGITTVWNYDHTGRLLNVKKNVGTAMERTISRYSYDALGQLLTKKVGQKRIDISTLSNNPIEEQQFSYNIRGWLKGINWDYISDANRTKAMTNKWFAMDLSYDWGYSSINYNGNISGQRWQTAGDKEERTFGYGYDGANRFMKADFKQNFGGNWQTNNGSSFTIDFSVKMGADGNTIGDAYDGNGNILRMQQWGLKLNQSPLVDDLNYRYTDNQNRLKNVADAVNDANTVLGDFKTSTNHPDAANTSTSRSDYAYDRNGNLIKDLNKDLGNAGNNGVSYNPYAGLPYKIVKYDPAIGGEGIASKTEYIYDASGMLHQKRLTKTAANGTSKITATDYLGGYIYENNLLQFAGQEEGRIRFAPLWGATVPEIRFDYYIKDHLSNTRAILSDEWKLDIYQAGLEDANRSYEEQLFARVTETQTTKPGGFDADNGNAKVAVVNGNSAESRIGPNTVLKVMAGDQVKLRTMGWYQPSANTTPNNGLGSIVNYFLSALATGVQAASAGKASSTLLINNNLLAPPLEPLINNRSYDNTRPKAYLNWVLLDEEQYKSVEGNAGFVQVPTISGEMAKQLMQANEGAAITIQKNGYLVVFVSNESYGNVYFDDIRVEHQRGALLEENQYYPYGLKMQGISSKAATGLQNNYLYQGDYAEYDAETGYNEFELRHYDAQTGRWTGVDPYQQFASPYVAMGANPVSMVDPDGGFTKAGAVLRWVANGFNGKVVPFKGEWGLRTNGFSASTDGSVTAFSNTNWKGGGFNFRLPNVETEDIVRLYRAFDENKTISNTLYQINKWNPIANVVNSISTFMYEHDTYGVEQTNIEATVQLVSAIPIFSLEAGVSRVAAKEVVEEVTEQAAKTSSNLWKVGSYSELRGLEVGLDAHHVGQKALMNRFAPGYNASTAPSILVPKLGHTIGSGVVSRGTAGFTSARQVLARDIFELRRVYGSQGIPNSSLQQLIQMNKTMYPGAFIK